MDEYVTASRRQLLWDEGDILIADDYRSKGWTTFFKTSDGEVVAVAENVRMFKNHPVFKQGITARFSFLTRELFLQLRMCSGEGTEEDVYFNGYVERLDDHNATLDVVTALAEQIYVLAVNGASKASLQDNPWVGCECEGHGFINSVDGKTRTCPVCKGLAQP
jgi:hypothetical protein